MSWKGKINESISTFLYDTKDHIFKYLNKISFGFALIFLILGTVEFGYHLDSQYSEYILHFNTTTLVIYSIDWIIRLIYNKKSKGFWKPFLYPFIIISFYWYHPFLKITTDSKSLVLDNICLTLLSLYYLSKGVSRLLKISIRPSRLFLASFILISTIGGFILSMPEMTYHAISFTDALFTSVSATCVTGLAVVDTGSFFTWKGQLVILFLIQIGGIGILSFASFFMKIISQGLGIRHQSAMDEIIDHNQGNTISLLKEIVFYTLAIELIGAIGLFTVLGGNYEFSSIIEKVYFSIFHSISAFCNAGFSLMPNSLVGENAYVQLVFIVIIILGSFGFASLKEIIHPKYVRQRIIEPWRTWSINTKIAVYGTATLIISGALIIYFSDLIHLTDNSFENIVASLFQSVTTRTAGFNSIDYNQLGNASLLFMMFLMFIGANSGSTGGGIKTSTVSVLFFSTINAIRGRSFIKIGQRQVLQSTVNKAFSILFFALGSTFIGFLALCYTEPDIDFKTLLFEEISAISTTGLSLGITSDLNTSSKYILIISMWIGRVGLLNLAFSLASPVSNKSYQVPEADIQIG